MTDLRDIAARVMALSGPDREVDAEIELIVRGDGWRIQTDCEHFPHMVQVGRIQEVGGCGWANSRHYTASVDAALALTPAGKHPVHLLRNAIDRCLARHIGDHDGFLKALPRFITAAALLARSEP
jgi:hypothetical protein